jgi:hypothetical protein
VTRSLSRVFEIKNGIFVEFHQQRKLLSTQIAIDSAIYLPQQDPAISFWVVSEKENKKITIYWNEVCCI